MPGVSSTPVPRSRLELLAEFYERAGQDAAARRDFKTACRCRELAIALWERANADRRALLDAERAEFDASLRTQNGTARPRTGSGGRAPATHRNGHRRPRAMTRTGDSDDSGSDSDGSDSDSDDADPAPGLARASFVLPRWWVRR